MKEDGGPAFPSNKEMSDGSYDYYSGLSIRDWFAGMALSFLADPNVSLGTVKACVDSAQVAYWVADAMLDERSK
jgi:hypothetical protein